MPWFLKVTLTLATLGTTVLVSKRVVVKYWRWARTNAESFSIFLFYLAGVWYLALLCLFGIMAS